MSQGWENQQSQGRGSSRGGGYQNDRYRHQGGGAGTATANREDALPTKFTPPIKNAHQANLTNADSVGKILYQDGFTTTQLRKFLSELNKLRQKLDIYVVHPSPDDEKELMGQVTMLAPRLKYQIAKEEKKLKEKTKAELTAMANYIEKLTNKDDFIEFAKYFEAVVAYFKHYGGKDS